MKRLTQAFTAGNDDLKEGNQATRSRLREVKSSLPPNGYAVKLATGIQITVPLIIAFARDPFDVPLLFNAGLPFALVVANAWYCQRIRRDYHGQPQKTAAIMAQHGMTAVLSWFLTAAAFIAGGYAVAGCSLAPERLGYSLPLAAMCDYSSSYVASLCALLYCLLVELVVYH